jgi:hypothetical protein
MENYGGGFFRSVLARQGTALGRNRELKSQLLHFIVVIFAVEDGPFFGSLDDGAALALDLQARGLIDTSFLHEEVFENFADFEADGVAVFDEFDFVQLGDGVGDNVSEFVDFVAAQSHGVVILLSLS